MNRFNKYILLILGNLMYAFSIYFFMIPNGINTGGLIGYAQLFDHLLSPLIGNFGLINLTGIFNLILNIPLFLLAYSKISKEFLIKTVVSIVVQSIVLSVMPYRSVALMPDILSNLIIAALICGVGIGFTLRSSGCSGGLDILGVYFTKTKNNYSVGRLAIVLNGILFLICAFIFNVQSALYSIMFVLIVGFVSDKVHYQNISIFALIFTKNDELKEVIMQKMGRGVTYWNGKGGYTDSDVGILACALNKYEIRTLKKIVGDVDPNAFVMINESKNINGNFEKRL
ncbi:MAG: YitT family protein [Erysipelotrichaceae bacterium]